MVRRQLGKKGGTVPFPGSLWERDVVILTMNTNERLITLEVDADSPARRGTRVVTDSLSPLSLALLGINLLVCGLQT